MDTADFSDLLLTLYRAAAKASARSFRDVALETVRRSLPFDAAIWGSVSAEGHATTGDVWTVDGASQEIAGLIRACPTDDLLLHLIHATPGRTRVFRPTDMPAGTLSASLTALTGMQHVMFVASRNEELGIFHVQTLGRRRENQPFTAEEQSLMQLLAPHLEAMVARNFEAHVTAAMMGDPADAAGLAVLNDSAMVLMAEPNFVRLLRREWPAWNGPQLPGILTRALRAGKPAMAHGETGFRLVHRGGRLLAIAYRISALDRLTQKEYSVAADFALGKSYKEVARDHGLSPETVRSRLRMVYEKTGICDKAELSRCFERSRRVLSLQELL